MTLREKEKSWQGKTAPKGKETGPSKEAMADNPKPHGQTRPPYRRGERWRDKPFIDNSKYDKNVYKGKDAEEKPAPHNDANQQGSKKCYNCGSPDHLSNRCDKPRKPRPVFVWAAHTVLNDEDSGNEPSGDDGSISEKQPDQDEDDRSEIEIEVTDAENYENSAEEFMMAMGVTTPNNPMNEKTCEIEIEEDEEKMEHLAASIVFPLSKITQQNNTEGVKNSSDWKFS